MRKEDFPVLQRKDVAYLDSACMSLKPEKVLEAVQSYYRNLSACPGRSSHSLSRETTEKVEAAREKVANFIDAEKQDIAFTSGTTESLNLASQAFEPEKVVVSDKEHNSNLLPWQENDIHVLETGEGLDMERLDSLVDEETVVSLYHRSNVDGSELPIREISKIVHENDGFLVVDAAQSVSHTSVSVEALDPDFLAFSGHKALGPTGTGVLYASDRVKEKFENVKTGGSTVNNSRYRSAEYRDYPDCVEAGLPNAAGIIGLGAAVEYLQDIGLERIERHEKQLSNRFRERAQEISGLRLVGDEGDDVFSMRFDGIGSHQVAEILDRKDIAVRAGRHCVHSWFNDRDEEPAFRASLHLYNDEQDLNEFFKALEQIAVLNR